MSKKKNLTAFFTTPNILTANAAIMESISALLRETSLTELDHGFIDNNHAGLYFPNFNRGILEVCYGPAVFVKLKFDDEEEFSGTYYWFNVTFDPINDDFKLIMQMDHDGIYGVWKQQVHDFLAAVDLKPSGGETKARLSKTDGLTFIKKIFLYYRSLAQPGSVVAHLFQ